MKLLSVIRSPMMSLVCNAKIVLHRLFLDTSRHDKSHNKVAPEADGLSEPDEDELLFLEIDKEITRDKLFLDSKLGRDMLCKHFKVDKNRLGRVMSKYSEASNISVYINVKRVEYAAKLLLEHPEFTIVTIATECGMSNTVTFNRTFKDVFGITPSEYRAKAGLLEDVKS